MPRPRTVAALAAAGALLLTPHAVQSATGAVATESSSRVVLAPAGPPVGKAWLVGVVTDQAGHTLNGVNVEAWSTDPEATAPVASDLTYESIRNDGQNGFFNLEVPIHASYVIVFSRPATGVVDHFRTFEYNGGKPISVGLRKERTLGTIELVHEGQVASRTIATLKPATVKAGKTSKLTVRVTSKFVDPVKGKVSLTFGGDKLTRKPVSLDDGRLTFTVRAPRKPGRYPVVASFTGSSTVKKSSDSVRLTVKK